MTIDRIDLYRVSMPLIYPFRTAFGNDDMIESVLVRMESDGTVGWGETAPWRRPGYSSEWAAGVFLILKDVLAPMVTGQDVTSGEQLRDLLKSVKDNRFAKGGLDLAWWDLHSKQLGQPLWRVLGGRGDAVDVGADFGVMETIDLLLETIDGALERGFKRIKLKYRPGWDLPMIRAVRGRFPDAVIHIDCNSAYRLADREMFHEIDKLGLAMIEQPLAHNDLVDHAVLQSELKTPICLDESITCRDAARKAIRTKACGWVNIKPGRVGGLTEAVAIHNVCMEAGVPCWVGGMLESSVGAHHCTALASLPNMRYPADIFPSDRFYRKDLSLPPMVLSAPSRVALPDTPGCGAEPDPTQLQSLAVETASILQ